MDTYNSLLEGDWRMNEIDSMDMLGFLGVRAWNARKEKKKKEPRRAFMGALPTSVFRIYTFVKAER